MVSLDGWFDWWGDFIGRVIWEEGCFGWRDDLGGEVVCLDGCFAWWDYFDWKGRSLR